MTGKNRQTRPGHGGGHVRHGRPRAHLQRGGTATLVTVSLRLAQISVNTARSEGRCGLSAVHFPTKRHSLSLFRTTPWYDNTVTLSVPLAGDTMRTVTLMVLLAGWLLIDQLTMVRAQPSVRQQRDGTSGTLPSHTFSSPRATLPGTITPFGTPPPPNLLTPAPLLPLNPKSMVTPQPQAPVSSGAPGSTTPLNGRPAR